jgi:gas vesicle protein
MSDTGKVLGALVLGVAAGAALGLLFAPSKGSELRQKISDNASDILDELNDKIGEGKDVLSELKDKVTSKVDSLKNKAEEEIGNVKGSVKQTGSTVGTNNTL